MGTAAVEEGSSFLPLRVLPSSGMVVYGRRRARRLWVHGWVVGRLVVDSIVRSVFRPEMGRSDATLGVLKKGRGKGEKDDNTDNDPTTVRGVEMTKMALPTCFVVGR